METPKKLLFPMVQHIGPPCTPIVKKGDFVKVGQKIGDSTAPLTAPIYSSVSGEVTNVLQFPSPQGVDLLTVEITSDGEQQMFEEIAPPKFNSKSEFIKAIRESGLVGLGGAGFPTHIKFSPPPDKPIEFLVVNGAECEPYITSDYREMLEFPNDIINGILLVKQNLNIPKVVLAIESNKPEAIKILNKLVSGIPDVSVVSLKTIYPQGSEKQLIYAATGRTVPSGKLPIDVGILVQNVNTLSFISKYFATGIPLITKRITVAGSLVKNPSNVQVPIGSSLQDVFNFCGGLSEDPYKIIMGGPMMGVSQFSLDNTVLKQTNALLALSKNDCNEGPEMNCIRCSRCVFVCPMNLMPLNINKSANLGDFASAAEHYAMDCIECGCCSFICPSKRHLVQSIRLAKNEIRKLRK